MDSPQPNRRKLNIALDFKLISGLLLLIIAIMLIIWKPWQPASGSDGRTVQVTGEAKISAEPDQYVFYPRYEFVNADRSVALENLKQKNNEILTELKKLGVPDNKIKTNADGYSRGLYPASNVEDGDISYSLSIEVTVESKEQAEKVVDYLVTTEPSGGVSPQAQFSDAKRKQLEDKARDEATKDARKKAEQSARNLGYRVGKVKTVSDSTSGPIFPMDSSIELDSSSRRKMPINPGENDLNYTVMVTFFID